MKFNPTPVLFVFSFLSAATYVMLRTLAVSLFLARVGTDFLPLVLAIAAGVVLMVSFVMRCSVRRFSTVDCAAGGWLALSVISLVLAGLINTAGYAVVAIYVFAEVRGGLGAIFNVSLANDAFAQSASKRPYAIVASGAPIAGVIVGFLLGLEAQFVGHADLLYIMATIDGLAAGILWGYRKQLRSLRSENRRGNLPAAEVDVNGKIDQPMNASTAAISPRQYRLQLSMLVGLKVVVLTLIGFQWKVSVADFFGDDEAKLVAYFALFYAISDVLIITLQWLAAGDLLDRFGIGVPLKSFPIALAIIGACAWWMDTPMTLIVVFSIARGTNVLRRSFHDPALSSTYSILDPTIRRETIVIVKGIIKPIAESVTAICLIVVGSTLSHSSITVVWLLVLVPWFIVATLITQAYRNQRQATQ